MAVLEKLETALTNAQVEQFWEQGYVLVEGALSPEEAAHYRNLILDMVPRDLNIPMHWHAVAGRLKPMHPDGDHTFDTPELLPLLCNPVLYRAAVQLLGSPRLRAIDGSLGITLRHSGGGEIRSQGLHLDASVPQELDEFLFTPEELQVGGCYYFGDVEPEGGGIHVVPGGHRLVEERARAQPMGRQLNNRWKRIEDFPPSVEVTGPAGSFALLHHLMPHAASHNRRSAPRVAQFTRFIREDHPHNPAVPAPPGKYNERQLAAMTPLGRKLLGVDPWDD